MFSRRSAANGGVWPEDGQAESVWQNVHLAVPNQFAQGCSLQP
jgi:hypothetical protein